MTRGMRRSAIVSFSLHLVILLALIITLPAPQQPASDQDSFSLDVQGPAVPQEGPKNGHTPAPMVSQTVDHAPMATEKPKPQPFEAPPPPPPPPPESTPAPPAPKAPPKPVQPPPTQALTQNPAQKPPPPPKKTPTKQKATAVPKTPMHQPHEVKNPALSSTVLNTLLKLESQEKQTKAPTHVYNPDQGGAPDAGGVPESTANSQLSGADKNAIAAHVRPCFNIDAGAPGLSNFEVHLLVTTGPDGVVHEAVVAPQDADKMSDPIYNAYANDAMNAVQNYQCATLPLPASMLGQEQTFLFDFVPQ